MRPATRWPLAAVAVLLAASIGVQAVRDRGWAPYEPPNPVLWLRSGTLARRLALGFDNLLADVYWMRAVVYYGGTRRGTMDPARRTYALLHPLLELVTTLDPHFKVAYRFGAIFLTEAYPSGPGRPDQAVALLERGVEADPRSAWEYMQDIGFVHYWWLRDYAAAAAWFDRSSRQPGAPLWMRPLAAATLARGGDRASSRFLWTEILRGTDVEWLRRNAQLRLAQLDAMDQIDRLNAASARHAVRAGHPARSWSELMTGEGLGGVPLDPGGVPFVMDPNTGLVRLSRRSPLWPLPAESPAQGRPPA